MIAQPQVKSLTETASMADLYKHVRSRTLEIVAPLEIEDYVIQTAEFMSPPRWHIGHTSWFFETVLQKYKAGYKTYSEDFLFYFNSYYEGFGARIERPKRGSRSRPTVAETKKYRAHIDEQMSRFIETLSNRDDAETILSIIRLGLEHEMQHQELLVYDIKHLLCDQFDAPMKAAPLSVENVSGMVEVEGGLFPVAEKANEPVSHVSFLEGSAYAKWAGKRLPTEAEWEKAATFSPSLNSQQLFPWGDSVPDEHHGNLFENGLWGVAPIGAFPNGQTAQGCHQMIGDVWEWTNSDYVPYPGFKSEF